MTHSWATGDVLDVLSRSRPPSDGLDSRLIRLSRLRAEGGHGVAVLRVARNAEAAERLRAQRRLVAEIASQPGLDEHWRDLLPRVLSFDERRDATVCVESYRPGLSLTDALAEHRHRIEELTAVAVAALTPLHRATVRSIVVDNLSAVRQWVVEPVTVLTQAHPRMSHRLRCLEEHLTRALVGRRMTVCWTHGAYTPDNVQLAGPHGPVNRVVGWGRARGDRPALIDLYLMVLTAGCQARQVDLSTLVADRVRSGGLMDWERRVLVGATGDTDAVDERIAIVLAWLHHTATQCGDGDEGPEGSARLEAVLTAVEAVRTGEATSRNAEPVMA